jgi:hypothetical protein
VPDALDQDGAAVRGEETIVAVEVVPRWNSPSVAFQNE